VAFKKLHGSIVCQPFYICHQKWAAGAELYSTLKVLDRRKTQLLKCVLYVNSLLGLRISDFLLLAVQAHRARLFGPDIASLGHLSTKFVKPKVSNLIQLSKACVMSTTYCACAPRDRIICFLLLLWNPKFPRRYYLAI
jgi:hypothetical protein